MPSSAQRQKVSFTSGGSQCAAWFYPATGGACVIMAAGLAVIKEAGTDPIAHRLHAAGYNVLAFDYRRLGESKGSPRQLVTIGDQLDDFQAAIDFASTLPGVDKLAIWGFSISGGHVFTLAARNPHLAAAIAHAPAADGLDAMRNALRHMTALSFARTVSRAAADAIGGRLGRQPLLVPLAGARGTVAALTTPDSRNYVRALNPANRYPQWEQAVAARSALRVGFYRPARIAAHITCPLLVVAYDNDGVAPPGPAIRAAQRAPLGELARIPGGHYAGFLDSTEQTMHTLLSFLDRHLQTSQHLHSIPDAAKSAGTKQVT
ncbi:alpha/beta hydrolase [Mycobacterium sp. 852002-51971_SCH5477799-a]|nr:alpha/beta hydrolase [Mycobacterium sp. 852002-51971_SCH5477799-a]OBF63526.1 alpha/beta hydrolase [Mycobacterium sp. 852002-51971_SCH5477799-a]